MCFVWPTGTSSISLRPGSFQREASFSFTAGRKQFNTHERSSGGGNPEDATRDWTKWHNISSLCIYNEDTWPIIDEENKNITLKKMDDLKELMWRPNLQSAGLVLSWQKFLTSIISWSCVRALLLLTGYRSVCFPSVLGSEETFSVTGEEVVGL